MTNELPKDSRSAALKETLFIDFVYSLPGKNSLGSEVKKGRAMAADPALDHSLNYFKAFRTHQTQHPLSVLS
jgi:hypothetical protein